MTERKEKKIKKQLIEEKKKKPKRVFIQEG